MLSTMRNSRDKRAIIFDEYAQRAKARCGIGMECAVWDGEHFGNDGLVRLGWNGMEWAKGQNVSLDLPSTG